MSPRLYTVVAHKFLSAIVYQVVPSPFIDMSQSEALWNIPLAQLPAYNVVQLLSGTTGVFLKQRTEHHLQALEATEPSPLVAVNCLE